MKRGLFITFEGGEGSGKSTQARLLADVLKKRGVPVVHTREPGGTSIAESVRKVLLNPASRIAPLTELLLYEAARAQHLAEVVGPALAAGRTVICERYTDATVAYQGYGLGLDPRRLEELSRVALDGLEPELVLVFDLPVPVAVTRRGAREDRIEAKGDSFQERVRAGFLDLARRDPGRFRVIDATAPREAVLALAEREILGTLARRP